MAPYPVLVDGRLVPPDEPVVRADDGAYASGLGCYSTARFERGQLRHGPRVADRLSRDAARLGLGDLDRRAVLDAFERLARAAFGEDGPGIVRLQASADSRGALHLVGRARDVGDEPAAWHVRIAPEVHEHPGALAGIKLSGHPQMARMRAFALAAGVQEVLLFDGRDRLVEGCRSTPIVCDADGQLCTPPSARGGVAGVAREILLERVPELREADVTRDALADARELVMVNSVRGARPVRRLDDREIAGAGPGRWAERLREVLDAEE